MQIYDGGAIPLTPPPEGCLIFYWNQTQLNRIGWISYVKLVKSIVTNQQQVCV